MRLGRIVRVGPGFRGDSGRLRCSRATRPRAAMGWVLVPMLLAVRIAAGRDDSAVIAIVLTFILGWIGVLLVWGFLGRRRRDAAALRLNT